MANGDIVPTTKPPESAGQMDLALAREFLEVSRKDIEIRGQELALRKDSQSQGHEYALAALKEQGADRQCERTHRRSGMLQYLVFAGIVLLMLLVFAGVALMYNKEQVVLETLKIVGPFAGGMGAGAFFGYRKGQRDAPQSPPEAAREGE